MITDIYILKFNLYICIILYDSGNIEHFFYPVYENIITSMREVLLE